MVGYHRIGQFDGEHHLIDRPHALLWLASCYAIPASMNACHVWGTRFMKKGSEFDSPLQTAHLCFLKGVLVVKSTTPNWAVLRECRQEPLQLYWFRAAAKFLSQEDCACRYCSALLTKNAGLRSSEACEGLHASDRYTDRVKAANPLPLQDFLLSLFVAFETNHACQYLQTLPCAQMQALARLLLSPCFYCFACRLRACQSFHAIGSPALGDS